jgi:hypothetical protein
MWDHIKETVKEDWVAILMIWSSFPLVLLLEPWLLIWFAPLYLGSLVGLRSSKRYH